MSLQLASCALFLSLNLCSATSTGGFLSIAGTAESFKECDDQDRFDIFMCSTFMCSQCTMDFCTKKCQEIQDQFPSCRCRTWPDARTAYSGGDFEGKGQFGDVGDYAGGDIGQDVQDAPKEEPEPTTAEPTVTVATVVETTSAPAPEATTTAPAPAEPDHDLGGPFGKFMLKVRADDLLGQTSAGIPNKRVTEEAVGDALSTLGGCGEKDCEAHLGTDRERFPGVWYYEFKYACKTCAQDALERVACRTKSSCAAATQQVTKLGILQQLQPDEVAVTRICSPGDCP